MAPRYFDVIFGIDYTIIARDEAHVLEILREADMDFEETLAAEGEPSITEINPVVVSSKKVWDDHVLCLLTDFPIGSYFSSEF